MPTDKKVADVAEIKERIEKSQVVIMSKYIGINAAQATSLRSKLRGGNVEYKVYKNTLGKRALDELGLGAAAEYLQGPTAWAFCEDPVSPAKVLKEFNKDVPLVEMNGGILDGKAVSKSQLEALADLPSREQLIAQVVGVLAAPMRNAVGVLSAVPRDFVNVIEAIKKKKEEAA